jgi:glycosyltransferase involved in cell wall biosynthesis
VTESPVIDVLLISGNTVAVPMLREAVRKLEAEGARVSYAASVPAIWYTGQLGGIDFADKHRLPRANLRRAANLPFGERVWLRSRKDAWLREHAAQAHVIVALEEGSVYTVWELAQRNRTAKAVYGVAPALNAVRELAEQGAPAPKAFRPPASLVARDFGRALKRLPDATGRALTTRRLMRRNVVAKLWRLPLRAPGVPQGLRVATGRRVAEAMRWADKHSGAAYALALTASKVKDPAVKAQLLDDAASMEFGRGVVSKHVNQAVKALLVQADAKFAAGEYQDAAMTLRRALVLGFHRVTHIDQLTSPLADNPERFVKPFHASEALQAIMAPRGRERPPAEPPTDRPLRLLIATSANDNFLRHLLDRYREHPDVEVRYLDFTTQPSLKRILGTDWRVLATRMGGDPEYAALVEDLLRPHLDWADTLFLDWCVGPAAMLTTIDPGDTRVIVRLHSYEVFTRWTQLVDFSRIDDLVFVADHVRDLATSLAPQLRGPQAPRMPMLHNAMELAGFAREKAPDARFNIGLVGVSQVAKDPIWAVDLLRLLRAEDERYRLLLVGGDMDPGTSQATRKYRNRMERVLKPLVASGQVLRLGPTDDVAGKLTDIGFVISSSVREGSHVGVMEGAASGAVPVVRDWPFYAGKANSARTLYPDGWVVDTPAEAAHRVLEVNTTEGSWADASKLASEYALSTWDWSVVSGDFDELFLGDR